MKGKNFIYILITLMISLNFACSNKVAFQSSKIVPAAEGMVKVKKLKNGNFAIEVKVEKLAHPDRLKHSRKYYVVWCRAKGGDFNLGLIEIDESLEGVLNTESVYKPKRIIISAEDDDKAVKIGKQKVLKSKRL